MRYNELLQESAARELAEKLPTLIKHDYNSIDKLMQHISARHKITGKKLHDLFVHKYGHTPDVWIKKLKNKLGEESINEFASYDHNDGEDDGDNEERLQDLYNQKFYLESIVIDSPESVEPEELEGLQQELEMINDEIEQLGGLTEAQRTQSQRNKEKCWPGYHSVGKKDSPTHPGTKVNNCVKNESALKEGVDSSDDIQKIKDFINWSIKQLHIQKPYPKITLSRNTKVAQQGHHTGVHTEDNKIWVYIENRNLIDIFRTIFHELVHERQSQLNMIKDGDSYPGSPIEAMADVMAGKYIKIYGKDHPEIFQ